MRPQREIIQRSCGLYRGMIRPAFRVVLALSVMWIGGVAGVSSLGADVKTQGWSKPTTGPEHLVVSRVRVLTTDGGRLDWGADGRIVFDRRGKKGKRKGLYDVWLMDPRDPATERRVTSGPSLPVGHRGNPVWHPSGDWILFQAGIKVGNALVTHPGSGVANELWVVRPDGTDARRIFHIAKPNAHDGSLHPHFDSDGDRIVFSRYRGLPTVFEINMLSFDVNDPKEVQPVPVLPAGDKRWQKGLYETHGFTADDQYIVFTGCSDPKAPWNNDILIADPVTRDLADQVTNSPDWDEHAHFQPGTRRLLYSSVRGLKKRGFALLFPDAEWWIREEDGVHHRLTWFTDPSWPLRTALGPDGDPIAIPSTKLFAADGAWAPDGSAYAGVLLIRERRWPEWIVIVEFE